MSSALQSVEMKDTPQLIVRCVLRPLADVAGYSESMTHGVQREEDAQLKEANRIALDAYRMEQAAARRTRESEIQFNERLMRLKNLGFEEVCWWRRCAWSYSSRRPLPQKP